MHGGGAARAVGLLSWGDEAAIRLKRRHTVSATLLAALVCLAALSPPPLPAEAPSASAAATTMLCSATLLSARAQLAGQWGGRSRRLGGPFGCFCGRRVDSGRWRPLSSPRSRSPDMSRGAGHGRRSTRGRARLAQGPGLPGADVRSHGLLAGARVPVENPFGREGRMFR